MTEFRGLSDTDPRLIRLAPDDNIAVVARPIAAGERIAVRGRPVAVDRPLDFGHKLALDDIAEGARVVKYGAPIGRAVRAIKLGEHVHTHNLASAYIRTFARDGEGAYDQ